MSSTLFLFAHQDDEFGVFQKIVDELATGRKVYCAYLTNGVPIGRLPSKRNQESISVLMRLGVSHENILFIGEELSIHDGKLVDNLKRTKEWLVCWLSQAQNLSHIYLPAWEGGHPDHDSLHALGVIVAKELNLLDIVWQYPLYNGYQCSGKFFRILLPLPGNGEIVSKKISWPNRLRYISLALRYPSQTITWIGLLPFMLIHYIVYGTQSLQRVSFSQFQYPPHFGRLYYERRNFCTWKKMSDRLREIY